MRNSKMKQIERLKKENDALHASFSSLRTQIACYESSIKELKAEKKALLEENVELLERLRRILKDEVQNNG